MDSLWFCTITEYKKWEEKVYKGVIMGKIKFSIFLENHNLLDY